MIRTPEEQRLTRSVYASAVVLRQYPGPSTTRRYAEIPGVGLYEWVLGSTLEHDGETVVVPYGGSAGAWLLLQPASGALAAVRAVSTVDVPVLSGFLTVDGVVTEGKNRVLLTAQTDNTANGVYVVPSGGGAWSRASDMKAGAAVTLGALCLATTEGAANGGKLWFLASPTTGSVTVGTTSLIFSPLS
jgi:hypothetical protein